MKVYQLMSNSDASANQTSAPVQKSDKQCYAVQFDFSSSALNGTCSLEASATGVNYVPVSGSSQPCVSGASVLLNVTDANYQFFRAKWLASSGTGTVLCTANLVESSAALGGGSH